MTPNEYQKLALRTEKTPPFVNNVVVDGSPIPSAVLSRLMHGAIGMATEVGELQDMLKKHLAYGKELDEVNVAEECGDVLWYIALALDACGYTMEQAMELNIAKLMVRFREKFTQDAALHRNLGEERKVLEQTK